MRRIGHWFAMGAVCGGLFAMALVALPLIALIIIATRAMFLVVVPMAVPTGILLYCCSARFRTWCDAVAKGRTMHRGLQLATDVIVHPRHSWARIGSGEAAVGADDFVLAVLGPVEAVELPAAGSRVQRGDRLFRLRRGRRIVDVPSPLSGTVLYTNEVLLEHPELINADPFGKGWAISLRASDVRGDKRCLLRGKRARSWFRLEADRLMATVRPGEAVTAVAHGGRPVPELYRQIDDSAWRKLSDTFLLEAN